MALMIFKLLVPMNLPCFPLSGARFLAARACAVELVAWPCHARSAAFPRGRIVDRPPGHPPAPNIAAAGTGVSSWCSRPSLFTLAPP
jgi:hypothetical protein